MENDNSLLDALWGLLGMARRSGIAYIGRERTHRVHGKLAFIWITEDITHNSRKEIGKQFPDVPVVEVLLARDLERNAGLMNAKVIGVVRSPLARKLREVLTEIRDQKSEAARKNHKPRSSRPDAGTGKRSKNVTLERTPAAGGAPGNAGRSRKKPRQRKPVSGEGKASAPNAWRDIRPPEA